MRKAQAAKKVMGKRVSLRKISCIVIQKGFIMAVQRLGARAPGLF